MFRFLKKKDGTKILQQKNIATLEWEDIPMVEEEETNKEKLMRAISEKEKSILLRTRINTVRLTILLSKKFHECLRMENNGLYSRDVSDIVSIYGHNVYVVNTMVDDFKILQEA